MSLLLICYIISAIIVVSIAVSDILRQLKRNETVDVTLTEFIIFLIVSFVPAVNTLVVILIFIDNYHHLGDKAIITFSKKK